MVLSFSKSRRLLANNRFRQVLHTGSRAGDGLLVVYALGNEMEHSRIGISVGKACGGAVVRNRLKRLVREAFRLNQDKVAQGFDYVVLFCRDWSKNINGTSPADTAGKLRLEQVADSLVALANRAGRKDS